MCRPGPGGWPLTKAVPHNDSHERDLRVQPGPGAGAVQRQCKQLE